MSVYLKLQPNEFADLLQLAQRERRDVRAQAAHMIHLALIDDAQKNPPVAGLAAVATSGLENRSLLETNSYAAKDTTPATS